jgi:hypothetical protein
MKMFRNPMVFSRIWENSNGLQFYQCFIVYDHSFLEWQFGGMPSFRDQPIFVSDGTPKMKSVCLSFAMVDELQGQFTATAIGLLMNHNIFKRFFSYCFNPEICWQLCYPVW